jgi:hypothetical protein
MDHPKLKAARDAISAVFSDTTVDRPTTRAALEELEADCASYLDALNDGDDE